MELQQISVINSAVIYLLTANDEITLEYDVDESVGTVHVCVNLTRPQIDILDETVNVFVVDNSSSVYISAGDPLASELHLLVAISVGIEVQLL